MAGGTLNELFTALGGEDTLRDAEKAVVRALHAGVQAKPGREEKIRASVVRSLIVHSDLAAGGQPAQLWIEGASIEGELDLTGLNLDFPVSLKHCRLGWLSMSDARLVSLDLAGSRCAGIGGDRLHVAHDLVMSEKFVATGQVRLRSVTINGDLNCGTGRFLGKKGALLLDGVHVGRRVYLRGEKGTPFMASSGVVLRSARIGGTVLCSGAVFKRELKFERTHIDGELSLRRAWLCGPLGLRGADIADDLDFEGAHVLMGVSGEGPEIDLARVRVGGSLRWRGVELPDHRDLFRIDLTQAGARYLDDDPGGWPGKARLDGFSFDGVAGGGDPEALAQRLDWFAEQPAGEWSAHPYDQLRVALRDSGYESAARDVAVTREAAREEFGKLKPLSYGLQWVYGWILGYGYKTLRFFVGSAVLMAVLAAVYVGALDACAPGTRGRCGDFSSPKADAPNYNGALYSADAFLPVDLKQVNAWSPRAAGWQAVVAGETVIGWIATALLLGAVTGVLRRD